jgi:hypothetical protein
VSQSQFVTRLQALKGEWLSQEDAILPIEPRFINDIKQGKKTAEYRSYIMPKVKRIWFCPNRGKRHITLMAKVLPAEEHNDKRPDGTKKRPYRYRFQQLYLVNKPFVYQDERLTGKHPSGPVYPNQPLNKHCKKLKSHDKRAKDNPINRINLLQSDYEYNRDGRYRKQHNSAHATPTSPPANLSVYENQHLPEPNALPDISPLPIPQLNAPQDRQHRKGERGSKYEETGKALSQSSGPASRPGDDKVSTAPDSRRCAKVDGDGRGKKGLTIGRARVGRGFFTEGHTSGGERYASVGPRGGMEGSQGGRKGVEVDVPDEAQDADDAVQGPALKQNTINKEEERNNRNLPTKKNEP